MRNIALIILRKASECLNEIIVILELEQLGNEITALATTEPPSTPGFSTPPTEPQETNTQTRPPVDTAQRNFPVYLFSWLKKFPGTVHRHHGQAFVGTCPTCVHVKNLGHPGRCTHDVHLQKFPTLPTCPWCYRDSTTNPDL